MAQARRAAWRGVAACVAGLAGICAGACLPRAMVLDVAASAPASPDAVFDWFDYAQCLKACVKGDKVDYAALCSNHAGLDRTLARMARHGPRSAPRAYADRAGKLAYWINAYNAAVLRSVVAQIAAGRGTAMVMVPERVARDPAMAYVFQIDGGGWTPAGMREEALRLAEDDWRVRFALCDGKRVGPPLFDAPFYGDLLNAQLDQAFRRALESPQVVWIDHGLQRVCVWSGLAALRGRLIAEYERRSGREHATFFNVLLDYATPDRRLVLNGAIGYEECVLPSDNRLNQAPVAP